MDVEAEVLELKDAVTAHEGRLEWINQEIVKIMDWRDSIQESIRVQKRMVEVGEAIIEALGWVAKASRWICQVVAAVALIWAAFKGAVYWSGNP